MLSDNIENFIKSLFEGMQQIEVRRNELAEYFRCAPSQINYVLATRFSADKGYIIESRRGGGGFIRIVRLDTNNDDYLLYLATKGIADEVSQTDARRIIDCLEERDVVEQREALLMKAAINDHALTTPMAIQDKLRSNIIRSMIFALMRGEGEQA